jgi:hypothetical protein
MAWVLVAGLAFVVVLHFARRRRTQFTIAPSESIATLHVGISKRQTAKTRSALAAATAVLR